MKNILLTLTMAILITPAIASAEHVGHEEYKHAHEQEVTTSRASDTKKIDSDHKIVVDVNGLVCDFCARALEKVFGKREGVAGIDVDLDNGKVTVLMKSNQSIEDDELTQLITNSGYNVVAIHRGASHDQ